MNIGFTVQKHPLNTFFQPLEPSRGLKIGPNWEFWYLYTYWDAFLGGSGWLFASQVYIHYGHWVHSLKWLQKHLFWAFRGLKRAQNWPKLRVLITLHLLGRFFWVVMGDSLLPKSIFIIEIRFIVFKDPPNTFFGPLEASIGLKICSYWEFWYLHLLGCFFGWFWVTLCFPSAYPLWTLGS